MSLYHRFRVAISANETLRTFITDIREGDSPNSLIYYVPDDQEETGRSAIIQFEGHYLDCTFTKDDNGRYVMGDATPFHSLNALIENLEDVLG